MLRILKSSTDGVTGHLTVHVQIEEVDGNSTTTGVLEVHGIHPRALQEQFEGDVKAWLDGVHRTMLQQHEDRKAATKAMQSLQAIGTIHLLDEEK
jgi:hypothetical protein